MSESSSIGIRPAREYEQFLQLLASEESRYTDPGTGGVRQEYARLDDRCVACRDCLGEIPVIGGYAVCNLCGTFNSVPRLRPEFLKEMLQPGTAADFFHRHVYSLGSAARKQRFADRMSLILQDISFGRVIETGCAMGLFLEQLLEAGFDAEGVEALPSAVELCLKRGLPVHFGRFEDAEFPEGIYHALFAWELLCHLDSPESFLEKAGRLLRPGGLLFLTTPNAMGLEYDTVWEDGSRRHHNLKPHVFLEIFSKIGIKLLLERTGYSIVRIETPGIMDIENMRELALKSGVGFSSSIFNDLILGDGEEAIHARAVMQRAVAEAGYSSHIYLVARKEHQTPGGYCNMNTEKTS